MSPSSRRFAILLVLLVAVLPACSNDEPSGKPAVAKVAPAPPNTDTDGPVAYAKAREGTLALGRVVVADFLAGKLDQVLAGHAPGPAKPEKAALEKTYKTLTAVPIGEQVEEAAVAPAPERRVYESYRKRGEAVVFVRVAFDGDDRITVISVGDRPLRPTDAFSGYDTTSHYRLPFDGVWWVLGSPDLPRQSLHYDSLNQRYAYDFQVWRKGSTHRGAGRTNAEYHAWNQAVRVPASGSVVRVMDGVRDHRPGAKSTGDPLGNHIVIDEGNGEYLVLGHLRAGSIRVRKGQMLGAGQLVATVGNSGGSETPMLHVHLQNLAGGPEAQGIPLTFADYTADGAPRPRGRPVQGQFVVIVPARAG